MVLNKQPNNLFFYRNHTNAADRKCWQCGRKTEDLELFFCECGVVQSVAEVDYFRLFGIERTFDIDVNELSVRLKELQKMLHPDKYTLKSEREKLLSEEQSSAVNKAYSTLSKPLSRALYLLELHGQPVEEDNSNVDQEFLMEIMEINEQLAEIDSVEKMKPFNEENNNKLEHEYAMLSEAFKHGDIKKAKDISSFLDVISKYVQYILNRKWFTTVSLDSDLLLLVGTLRFTFFVGQLIAISWKVVYYFI
ncbi:hypothetical protein KUTeg_018393 [Tegillarca granosa]|uniref:J domain-containing protein n=1 Tax=Tegillarca granosa TaxID=220873 RepID=A0ABQ9EMP3_TEGGR|nr:hypothetical protein KUTeg_018393 [Tegillarca granosa]